MRPIAALLAAAFAAAAVPGVAFAAEDALVSAAFSPLRFQIAPSDPLPGAAIVRPLGSLATLRRDAVEANSLQRWSSMFSVSRGALRFDITPHLDLGFSAAGRRSSEAGALVRMAKAVGIAGASAPHLYVYGGYNKRAVGLNLLTSPQNLNRERLDDGVAREVQAGLGARRGRFHALVGYTHEMVAMRSLGERVRDDDRVGLTLSIR